VRASAAANGFDVPVVRVLKNWALTRRAGRHAFRVLSRATLVLIGFAVLSIAAPEARAAGMIRGGVAVSAENGFARLVFTFEDDVEPQVKAGNGIIVITFKRPVDVVVDKLEANSGGYIGAVRRDPDGRGLRLALARRVTVNFMPVAEKLFVDLLPDSWTGLPPGLPREVIEELARRAREADKKLRQQRQLAKQEKMSAIRLRVAHQPTFTRYVFDLPELVGVAANTGKNNLTLTFDAVLKFDLADAKAMLPSTVSAIDSALDQEAAVVRFTFASKVDVRTFREGLSFIVDVTPMEAKSERSEAGSDDLPPMGADAAARARAPPGGVEPPQTVPALVPAAARPESAASAPVLASKPESAAQDRAQLDRAPPDRAPTDRASRGPAPSDSAPKSADKAAERAADRPADKIVERDAPPQRPNEAEAKEPKQPNEVRQGAVARASEAPWRRLTRWRRPAPAPAAVVETTRAAEADGAPQSGAVRVDFKRQGDNLSLQFPFTAATPAAVFTRADTLWLVFDTNATISLAKLPAGANNAIKSASVLRGNDLAIVRVKLERPRLVSAAAEGPTWTVAIGEVIEPTRSVNISRSIVGAARSSITVSFDEAKKLHRLEDPEAGDVLLVATALGPPRGVLKPQEFIELQTLATVHGVVLQPLADDLTAAIAGDKIVISRPAGLTLSPAGARGGSGTNGAAYQPHVLDTETWGADRQADFRERNSELIRAAAQAPEGKRLVARADLARFYLARDMAVEAKGVLDVALAESPPRAEDPSPLVLHAVANIAIGRFDAALKDLGHPVVGNQYDAPLWRAVAHARQGKWNEAREGFRSAGMALGTLPLEVQRMMLRDSVRASLEAGDVTGAVSQMHEFEAIGIPRELEPTLSVLTGRIAEGLGRIEDALRAYQAAVDSWDRPAASQARLRELVLKRAVGQIKRPDAITALETLTTVWRGDETEVEALAMLARLYTEDGRYRDAFHIMRTALAAHPNSEMAQRIRDEAAASFDGVFLAGKGDAMSPIEALSLFYDFRDLTPIGRRGDEMIRRLADRLVAVDLLDQAAELLQHQVDHRLQGAARAQVATRLAIVYLMNHKADHALATLRATRSADLSNDMRNQRLLLEARALSDLGRHDVAIEVIADIPGREALRLRADILWAGKRWRAAAEQIELNYGDRWREFEPLTDSERQDILRAAIGYVLGEDPIGMERFRERYAGKMGEGPDYRAFDVITAPVERSGSEFGDIAKAIAAVDTLTAFLRDLRTRYPESGTVAAPLPPAPAAPPQATAPQATPPQATTPQATPAQGATPQDRKADPSPTGSIPPRLRDDPAAASPLPLNPTTLPRPPKSRTAAR
jgi:tetratricopeptide (TPR) repeat protein